MLTMAQVRGCLTRLLRRWRQLTPHPHDKYLNMKICSWVRMCELPGQRISVGVHNIAQSYSQHRGLCVKTSAAEEDKEASKVEAAKVEAAKVEAAKTALSSVLQTIKTSANLQYIIKCNLEAVKDLNSLQNRIISEACFQRLMEFRIQKLESDLPLKINSDPLYKLTNEIIEKNIKKIKAEYLCSVLESLLQMGPGDSRLTKCIESYFIREMNKNSDMNIDVVKRLASIHQNHMESHLRMTAYGAAVKRLGKSDKELSLRLASALTSSDGPESPRIKQLIGDALSNIKDLNFRDIHTVLLLLSLKKMYNAPLIKAISNILGKQEDLFYTEKQLKDLFFSCSVLSIYDQAVLEKLTNNLFKVFNLSGNNRNTLYPQILFSCSRLNWKHFVLVSTLIDQSVGLVMSDSFFRTRLVGVLHSLAHLNWTTENELLEGVLAKLPLTDLKEMNPTQWLEIVWSLVVLQKATADMIQDVLAEEYLEKIEKSVSDKPEYVKSNVRKKLLNVTGCSVLEFNQEVKPGSYEAWMKQAKQDVANHSVTSSMGKEVETALKSFEHISLSTNKLLDYGYVADFELQLAQEMGGNEEEKKVQRVAVKLLGFKDMLRSELEPEPDGESVMCIRHLKKMGYHVVLVPYFEWAKQYDEELKQEYLKKQMPALKQRFN